MLRFVWWTFTEVWCLFRTILDWLLYLAIEGIVQVYLRILRPVLRAGLRAGRYAWSASDRVFKRHGGWIVAGACIAYDIIFLVIFSGVPGESPPNNGQMLVILGTMPLSKTAIFLLIYWWDVHFLKHQNPGDIDMLEWTISWFGLLPTWNPPQTQPGEEPPVRRTQNIIPWFD